MNSKNHRAHGKSARKPWKIPTAGWITILKRTYQELASNRISLVAAGVAFYGLLALFPLVAALTYIYGLLFTYQGLIDHLELLGGIMPLDGRQMLIEYIGNIIDESESTLSFGAIAAGLLSVWSASKGANALMIACNISYSEDKDRGLIDAFLVRLMMTLCGLVILLFTISLVALLPIALEFIQFHQDVVRGFLVFSLWLVLGLITNLSLSALYRYAPNRSMPKWRWVTPGSVIATLLWVGGSTGFSYFIANFSNYNDTYGSIGGVIVLLMWLYLSAYIVLLGAQFNAATEHQTQQDTTHGTDQPIGDRGAYVADTTPDTKDDSSHR